MFSEQASESRNKHYKAFRLHHARKFSRAATLEDVFYRSMDTSDPILSSYSEEARGRKRKKLPLPKAVIDLLASSVDEGSSDTSSDEEDVIESLTGLPKFMVQLDDLELSDEEDTVEGLQLQEVPKEVLRRQRVEKGSGRSDEIVRGTREAASRGRQIYLAGRDESDGGARDIVSGTSQGSSVLGGRGRRAGMPTCERRGAGRGAGSGFKKP